MELRASGGSIPGGRSRDAESKSRDLVRSASGSSGFDRALHCAVRGCNAASSQRRPSRSQGVAREVARAAVASADRDTEKPNPRSGGRALHRNRPRGREGARKG